MTEDKEKYYEARIAELMDEILKLREEIDNERKVSQKLGESLERATIANNSLEDDIEDLRHTIESQKVSRELVEDLRISLGRERDRLDEAIRYEREVDLGIRSRINLIPKSESESGSNKSTGPHPVAKKRIPWSVQQAQLEKESKKQADETEAYWRAKIDEVEALDSAQNSAHNNSEEEQDMNDLNSNPENDRTNKPDRSAAGNTEKD